MRNKYPGTCYRCGEKVPAGEGWLSYKSCMGSVWPEMAGYRNIALIEHDSCAITFNGTDTHYLYLPSDDDIEVIEK